MATDFDPLISFGKPDLKLIQVLAFWSSVAILQVGTCLLRSTKIISSNPPTCLTAVLCNLQILFPACRLRKRSSSSRPFFFYCTWRLRSKQGSNGSGLAVPVVQKRLVLGVLGPPSRIWFWGSSPQKAHFFWLLSPPPAIFSSFFVFHH